MTYQLHDGDGCSLTADRDGKDVLLVFRHHPDPRQAAVPPMAEFWDVAGGRRLEAFRPAVGLDPRFGWDGRTVLSICGDESFSTAFANACDGSVFWWDPATGRQAGEPWRPHRTAKCSALSADSLVLAARCDDQRGRLYDLATGLQRGGDIPLTGTRDTEPGLRLAVSPDGGSVLTGAADGTFRLWQTRGSELQASAASNPRPHGVPHNRLTFDRAAFRPDGRVALVAQLGEQAQPCFLVDVASGQALGQPLQLPNPRHLAFSADGRLAAMAVTPDVGPPSLRVWDAATGRPRTPPLQSPTLVHGLAFSPDGHTLAAAGVGGTFLFDVDRAALRALLHEGTTAYRLVFRPDGRRVAVAYKSGWTAKGAGFRLRDPVTAQPVGAFVPLPRPPDGLPVLHLSFAEGGRLLRVFDADNGRLHVHDAETGERRAEPSTLEPAEQVAFSPDGSLLATSSPNGHVRQWDAATGKALEPLLLSPSPVLALQFSGDGKVLAAVCQDHAVRLWDAATSLPLGPPLLHRAGVLGLAFRADGTLATVTATGRTQTWSLPEPVADDPERLQLWIEATAGVKLRGDEVALLDADDWRGKKGPPGDARPGPDDATWHERRALDAEEDGNTFALFWHLERLDKLRPGDWRVPARRGRAYRDAGDATRAGAAYEEAQARQPGEALRDWYRREAARWASLEKWTESLWYLERLAAAGADDAALYADRALVHGKLGHAGERDADLNRALERGAEDGVALPRVEEAAHAGHWEEAAAWCAKVKGGGPADPDFAYIQSLVCLKAGAAAGYRRACARALQALPPAGKPREGDAVNLVVVLCTLGPDGVSDWPPLLGRMERLTAALAGQEARVPSELRHEVRERRHAWLNTYGAALYRAGRYAEAVARLRSAIAAQGQGGTFRDWVFLALAHSGLGQTGEARPWLEKARAARPAAAPFSWEGLEADLLLAEAERRASGPAP
jgi:WD40 repeat protein/tetratricopeptide (TPR) repeat protein